MSWSSLNAADVFAAGMLGVILLSFGVIGLLLLHIRRQSRRQSDVDRLIQEVGESLRHEEEREETKRPSVPWERDPDWWRR